DGAANGRFGLGLAVWGGDVAAGAPAQGDGHVHLFRDIQGTAFISDVPGVFGLTLAGDPLNGLTLSWEAAPGARRYIVQSSADLLVWRDEVDVLPPATSWTTPPVS